MLTVFFWFSVFASDFLTAERLPQGVEGVPPSRPELPPHPLLGTQAGGNPPARGPRWGSPGLTFPGARRNDYSD